MIPATEATLVMAGLILAATTGFADELPPVEGTWLSGDGDGWIEIRIVGDGLSGVIAGSPNASDDRPDKDENNPDPALRDRALVGLEIFSGFEYAGKGRFLRRSENGRQSTVEVFEVDVQATVKF